MNQKAKIIGFHVFGWVLFFALVAAFVRGFGQNFFHFWALSFFAFVAVYVALFYLNSTVLLPELYFRKAYVAYAGLFALLFLSFCFLKPFDRLVLRGGPQSQNDGPRFDRPPPSSNGERPPPPPQENNGRHPQDLDIVSIVLFIAVWSASSVQQVIQQWRTSERRAMQAEADKVTAELLFLKAQINPHFLFNTLNNIYSLAITKSERTPDAVLKLSAILRYLTDDVRNDFVPLQSEVDCACNYIELQKLRLSKKATVEFSVEGAVAGKRLPPLLFMTFIENAFKYGTSNREPFTLSIRIRAGERSLHLFCRNRLFPREEEAGREGVGIGNAKKRLDYLYPKKHLLNVHTQDGHFTVDLTLIT